MTYCRGEFGERSLKDRRAGPAPAGLPGAGARAGEGFTCRSPGLLPPELSPCGDRIPQNLHA